MTRPGRVLTKETAVIFLEEAACYFERRPTGGEDRAYWANVYNAENCRAVAKLLGEDTGAVSVPRDLFDHVVHMLQDYELRQYGPVLFDSTPTLSSKKLRRLTAALSQAGAVGRTFAEKAAAAREQEISAYRIGDIDGFDAQDAGEEVR